MEHYSLELVSSEDAIEPVTVAELKAHLRYNQGDSEDTLMEQAIIAARSIVERATGRSLRETTWNVTYHSGKKRQLTFNLPLPPVATVEADFDFDFDDTSEPQRITLEETPTYPFDVEITTGNEVDPALKQLVLYIATGLFMDREGKMAGYYFTLPVLLSFKIWV